MFKNETMSPVCVLPGENLGNLLYDTKTLFTKYIFSNGNNFSERVIESLQDSLANIMVGTVSALDQTMQYLIYMDIVLENQNTFNFVEESKLDVTHIIKELYIDIIHSDPKLYEIDPSLVIRLGNLPKEELENLFLSGIFKVLVLSLDKNLSLRIMFID